MDHCHTMGAPFAQRPAVITTRYYRHSGPWRRPWRPLAAPAAQQGRGRGTAQRHRPGQGRGCCARRQGVAWQSRALPGRTLCRKACFWPVDHPLNPSSSGGPASQPKAGCSRRLRAALHGSRCRRTPGHHHGQHAAPLAVRLVLDDEPPRDQQPCVHSRRRVSCGRQRLG